MEDPFDDDDDDIDSGSRTPVASMDSKAPILARQPSLVDELLSEIYARFGNGLTSRSFDSSQRASASGSQVKRAIFRFLKGTSKCSFRWFQFPSLQRTRWLRTVFLKV